MNPELFLEQEDVVPLIESLNRFAMKFNSADQRRSVMQNASIHQAFLNNLNFNDRPFIFAQELVSKFKTYHVSNQRLDYHPMIKLLTYLSEIYGEDEVDDVLLFKRLAQQGEKNLKALAARNSVARIESPKGTPIGTGVLIHQTWVLTCNHIFSKSQVTKAWARFNYVQGSHELDSDIFELDLTTKIQHNPVESPQLDYAVAKVVAKVVAKEKIVPKQKIAKVNNNILNQDEKIRLIHHPQGKYAVISDWGSIQHVDQDYINHDVSTENGSSGAPIFNSDWQLVAIHRGNLGIAAEREQNSGTTSGAPLFAFWEKIQNRLID
ncbi:serine protease [Nostoc sphaeroides CHAB 2801]|uniref:trypsin-like peptidase domain-containing protein n=1 Tax=Nostoc sphaeroides TaxID=446679 RepID=UPI000E4CD8E1|nr:trypsin-like peptidase domain-containing protein [Nostoc sphaeroides]MCC5628136.1 serine protease [Nostoc sphaeroides CHAB 2801]